MQRSESEENCDAFYETIITGEWSGYFSIYVVIIIIAVNFFPTFSRETPDKKFSFHS